MMKTDSVCERATSVHLYEEDVARRWWALPLGVQLPLSNGGSYQLVFAGRPGGALGPDVRDAVLGAGIASLPKSSNKAQASWRQGEHFFGDIEFHIRNSDWFTHLHQFDPRYNKVVLHVVLVLDEAKPTLRQDGALIPTCSLYDLPHTSNLATVWPCQRVLQQLSEAEYLKLLREAGLLRFEQKTHTFVELVRNGQASSSFSAYDVCLISVLAEGLGYGRDRAFFRAIGLRLLGLAGEIPEPLGHTSDPSPLDAQRLRILHKLVEQWRNTGAWKVMREVIYPRRGGGGVGMGGGPAVALATNTGLAPSIPPLGATQGSPPRNPSAPAPTTGNTAHETIQALRPLFGELSTARADILICNVVLPFAAAVALIEQDGLLFQQAQLLYTEYPSLPSNQITRGMYKQLQFEREPQGACQQQGLHYIYQQTCREKQCGQCMLGKRDI